LNIATGTVITTSKDPHSLTSSLFEQDRCQRAEGLDVEVVLDNLATHKTEGPPVALRHRSSLPLHATYGSWMNLVERWFGRYHKEAQALRAQQREACQESKPG